MRNIDLAAGRTKEPLMYLEVSESNNPRSSFDIKLHDADLCLKDVGHWLSSMRKHYAIASDRFERALAPIGAEKLGHISGGINREGRDFLTVYYEAGGR